MVRRMAEKVVSVVSSRTPRAVGRGGLKKRSCMAMTAMNIAGGMRGIK